MPVPVVLGIDFGGSKIAVAIADPAGVRLASRTIPVVATDTAQHTFDRGIAAAREVLAGRSPLAVGACTFGIPRDDGVDLAPTIPGWEQLPFGRMVRAAFPGSDVRLATDVKAAAEAEARDGALAGHDPGLYLNLGTGLAAAVVVGGSVVNGSHGAAGEIGYNVRRPAAPYAGNRLEDAVSGKALAALAGEIGGAGVPALFDRADRDPRAARICQEFLSELGFHLANLAVAIDPARIVVGGGLVRSWERLRPALQDALVSAVPFPPELVLAAYPFDAPLIGAIAVATAAARNAVPGSPVISEGASA